MFKKELEFFDSKIKKAVELAQESQFKEALGIVDELEKFTRSIETRNGDIELIRKVVLAKPSQKPGFADELKKVFPDFFANAQSVSPAQTRPTTTEPAVTTPAATTQAQPAQPAAKPGKKGLLSRLFEEPKKGGEKE